MAWTAVLAGCGADDGIPPGARTDRAAEEVRRRWGKELADLPTVTLVLISAHNENIQNEFAWAFSLHHAVARGRKVHFEWRDVGGGGSSIKTYLDNVYKYKDSAGIDILWGGGIYVFSPLAEAGHLQAVQLPEEFLANVEPEFSGLPMYDKDRRWAATALSGFGFVYNAGILDKCGIEPPRQWSDLGRPRFADLIMLADPTQSGSAAATYQMIAQSADTWPAGWAKLLRLLSNAKRFTDSAGSAANAPLLGESAVAASIDFYGALRVAEAPDQMVYVSPRGETAFTPDPIAILRNPPNPELAQRFVDFVLSRRGQALWALRVGEDDGPIRSPLARQPVRRDVYRIYKDRMLSSIVNPYSAGQALQLAGDRKRIKYGVLKQLVRAAAVDNVAGLRAARERLIETNSEPARLAEFVRLPENVATLDAMGRINKRLKDDTQREKIVTDWQEFFREKYRRVARRD